MSRVAAVKNAFRPRPPGPVMRYTPEQILSEEVSRMGEPRNLDAIRTAVERWIMEHPRQTITAREIRSALSIAGRNMSAVRIIGTTLRRLCQRVGKQQRGAWVYRPGPAAARRALAADLYLADIVISVSIRPRAGAVVGPAVGTTGSKRR